MLEYVGWPSSPSCVVLHWELVLDTFYHLLPSPGVDLSLPLTATLVKGIPIIWRYLTPPPNRERVWVDMQARYSEDLVEGSAVVRKKERKQTLQERAREDNDQGLRADRELLEGSQRLRQKWEEMRKGFEAKRKVRKISYN